MLANDFLMELFRANALDVKTMLENSSFPFAPKILEAIKRNEEAAAQGGALQGIPPELIAQLHAGGKMPQDAQPGDALQQSKRDVTAQTAVNG